MEENKATPGAQVFPPDGKQLFPGDSSLGPQAVKAIRFKRGVQGQGLFKNNGSCYFKGMDGVIQKHGAFFSRLCQNAPGPASQQNGNGREPRPRADIQESFVSFDNVQEEKGVHYKSDNRHLRIFSRNEVGDLVPFKNTVAKNEKFFQKSGGYC